MDILSTIISHQNCHLLKALLLHAAELALALCGDIRIILSMLINPKTLGKSGDIFGLG
jgi:hypothetical protein